MLTQCPNVSAPRATFGNCIPNCPGVNITSFATSDCKDYVADVQPIIEILEKYVIVIIGSLGIIVNILAFITLLQKQLANTTRGGKTMANIFNRTLATLAIIDFLFILALSFSESWFIQIEEYPILMFLAPFWKYLGHTCMFASIYLTIVLALERYLSVSDPLSTIKTKYGWKNVLCFVAPVLLFSIFYSLPHLFEAYYCKDEENNNFELVISKFRMDKYYIIIYRTVLKNVLTGLIPLFALGILNYLIYKHISASKNDLRKQASGK